MESGQNGGNGAFGGSFSVPQNIISGNDIIVGQPENKKSHKGLVAGGILTIFCVAIITLLVFINFQNSGTSGSENLDKMNEEISNFSSAIMYGDGRRVDLSTMTYSDSINYKFRYEIRGGDQEYINSVIDKFNSIDDLILDDNNLNLTDEDKYYLGVYGDKLQFLKTYVDSLSEDPMVIIDKLVEGGEDEAISYIETRYSEYLNSSNSSLRDYFTYKAEYEKLAIDVLSRADVDGCISDDYTVLNCEINSLITEEETSHLQEIQREMSVIVDTNIKYVINGCWSIYNIVNGVEDA